MRTSVPLREVNLAGCVAGTVGGSFWQCVIGFRDVKWRGGDKDHVAKQARRGGGGASPYIIMALFTPPGRDQTRVCCWGMKHSPWLRRLHATPASPPLPDATFRVNIPARKTGKKAKFKVGGGKEAGAGKLDLGCVRGLREGAAVGEERRGSRRGRETSHLGKSPLPIGP